MKCKSCHRDMTYVKAPRYSGVYGTLVFVLGMGVSLFLVYQQPTPTWLLAAGGFGLLCLIAGAYLARATGELTICSACGGRDVLDEDEAKQVEQEQRDEVRKKLEREVRDELGGDLERELRPAVEAALRPQLTREIEEQLRPKLAEELQSEIEARVRESLASELRAEIEDELRPEIERRVTEEQEHKPAPEAAKVEPEAAKVEPPKIEPKPAKVEPPKIEPKPAKVEPLKIEPKPAKAEPEAAKAEPLEEEPEAAEEKTPEPGLMPEPPKPEPVAAKAPPKPEPAKAPAPPVPPKPAAPAMGPVALSAPLPIAMPKLAPVGTVTEPHQKAQRKARVIVSDVLLYDRPLVEQAVRSDDPFAALDKVWAEAQRTYNESVAADVRSGTDYLRDAFEAMFDKMRREQKA